MTQIVASFLKTKKRYKMKSVVTIVWMRLTMDLSCKPFVLKRKPNKKLRRRQKGFKNKRIRKKKVFRV